MSTHIANVVLDMWLAGCTWDDVLAHQGFLSCDIHQRQALYHLWERIEWAYGFNLAVQAIAKPNPCDTTKRKIKDHKK